MLLIDLLDKISLKGSPSSISNWFLITFSFVILFPKILILSTKICSPSSIIKFRLILSSSRVSSTDAETDSYCSVRETISNLSKIWSTKYKE